MGAPFKNHYSKFIMFETLFCRCDDKSFYLTKNNFGLIQKHLVDLGMKNLLVCELQAYVAAKFRNVDTVPRSLSDPKKPLGSGPYGVSFVKNLSSLSEAECVKELEKLIQESKSFKPFTTFTNDITDDDGVDKNS